MQHTLQPADQAELRSLISTRVFTRAISDALAIIQSERRGASTLEGCAMSFNHNEGALDLVNKLYFIAEENKPKPPTTTPRFRKITN